MSVFKKNGFVSDVSLDAVKSQPVSGTTNALLMHTLEVIHTLAQTRTQTYTLAQTHTQTYTLAQTHTQTQRHTQTYVVTCARACVHTHIHMSTRAHHAYIQCLAALLANAHM